MRLLYVVRAIIITTNGTEKSCMNPIMPKNPLPVNRHSSGLD